MSTLKVLIIDDDEDYASSLKEFMSLEGDSADIKVTAAAGIQAVREQAYDQILIDVVLPDMNGARSAIEIQSISPRTPILLMTGYSADHLNQSEIDTASVEVLTKPVDLLELSDRLNTLRNAKV